MAIDWAHFTPWASLLGGIVLGLASAIFILSMAEFWVLAAFWEA